MVKHELRRAESILIVEPAGPLEASDFEHLNEEVDPYILEKGQLGGLMIYTKSFPGWNDLNALLSHMRFVKNHLRKIERIAAVTDSALSILPQLASLFAASKIHHFDYANRDAALEWLKGEK
jgi:hypothetical protein